MKLLGYFASEFISFRLTDNVRLVHDNVRLVRLDDIGSLRPLWAVLDCQLHPLSSTQVPVALTMNCGVMDENVLLSIVGSDEPKSLYATELLNGPRCAIIVLHV